MWPFGKRQPKLPAPPKPKCAWCGDVLTHYGGLSGFWSDEDSKRPGWCHGCAYHAEERKKERRKRQEELAALVVGRLAAAQRGYRGELPEPTLLAAEAMRLAAAIIDSPKE